MFADSFERCGDFTVPAGAIVWDGGGDGSSWSDPLNWSGDTLPADDAQVAIPDFAGINVVYDNSAGTTRLAYLDSCETLFITGGTLELDGPAIVRSRLELTGGALQVDGNLAVQGPALQGNATLTGTGTLTVAGLYTWERGIQEGGGETVLNGGLSIENTTHTLRNRTLTLNAASTWTGGNVNLWNGSTINNNATFDIQTDADMPYTSGVVSTWNNNLAVVKSVGGDTTQFGADFVNAGDLSVTGGAIAFQRTFTQTLLGSLTVNIGSVAFDSFAVSQAATLDGTLDIVRVGGYQPGIGEMYQILTASSVSGTFAVVNGQSIGNGNEFSVVYGAADVTLEVVAE